jgi:hypothetical protein
MAILAYSASGVRSVVASSSQVTIGQLGEGVAAGQPVRLSSADGKYYQCDGDTVDPISAEFDGYALNNGVTDEKIAIQTGGTIYLGVAAVEGMLYCVSPTKGQTEEATSALVAGTNVTLIGYGDEDGNIVFNKVETAFTIPT